MLCCVATNFDKLALACSLRCSSRTYVVRLKGKPLQSRNSGGCSGWAEDVVLVSCLTTSEALPECGRSHNIWYRALSCNLVGLGVFFSSPSPLQVLALLTLCFCTDVIAFGIWHPKVSEKEISSVQLLSL